MVHDEQILCIDLSRDFRRYFSRQLNSLGYKVIVAENRSEAEKILSRENTRPRITFIDPLDKEATGTSIQDLPDWLPDSRIIALSGGADPRIVVESIKNGADDFISKPFTLDEIERSIKSVVETAPQKRIQGRESSDQGALDLVYSSKIMERIVQTSLQVAKTNIPVLLTGESGVGKDVVARFIHQNSNLTGCPFVKVNCAAMPENLVESELFGYRKGAFTGAYVDRPGKFEYANGGTIFLDEIGEFSSSVQAKLLQVLQEGKFSMLGENREIEVNVRIITATNRKLIEAIKEGRFREDLYYRLNVVNIHIPPLRERVEEIPELCRHFQKKFAADYHAEDIELSDSLLEKFCNYPWPGNVRELENILKRYVVLKDEGSIDEYFKTREQAETESSRDPFRFSSDSYQGKDLKEISRDASAKVEKEVISIFLRKNGWNKLKTAKELNVSYKTLLTKIDQFEIKPESM